MEELKIKEIRNELLEEIRKLTDSYAFEEVKNSNYSNYELYKILEELERFDEIEKMNEEMI